MSELFRKIQAARETWVEIGGHSFLLRRPTNLWFSVWRRKGAPEIDLLRESLIDWRGVTEADLVPSGGADIVLFDREAAIEWLADREDDLLAIADKLMQMMSERAAAKADTAKN